MIFPLIWFIFADCVYRHLEGASGIIGIIKAILMIKRGIILPTAGFEKFNPEIEGSDRLKVAKTTIPWPKNELKRVVITNFGKEAFGSKC